MLKIAKVIKIGNRLGIYLPQFIIDGYKLKEGDELDFFKFKNIFFVAKGGDLARLLAQLTLKEDEKKASAAEIGKEEKEAKAEGGWEGSAEKTAENFFVPNADELNLLKKLDSIRYGERTKEKVEKMLSKNEINILQNLLNKKVVSLYKNKEKEYYSISPQIYNRFLIRNKGIKIGKGGKVIKEKGSNQKATSYEESKKDEKAKEEKVGYLKVLEGGNGSLQDYIEEKLKTLEREGYIVVDTENEATELSKALEMDIRLGNVVGCRGFDKKYYIALSNVFLKDSKRIIDVLKEKEATLGEIAKRLNYPEALVKTMLTLLLEKGDVIEKRKNLFKYIGEEKNDENSEKESKK